MKYLIVALVLQIIALIIALVALGLEGYVYHYDLQFYRLVHDDEHKYFAPFMTLIYQEWYDQSVRLVSAYGPFPKHHRVRTRPYSHWAGNFLRHPKSEVNVFLALLILVILMQLAALFVTLVRGCRFLPRPCRENGWWHFVIAIVAAVGVVAEIVARTDINRGYDYFDRFENSAEKHEKTGALLLLSCGPRHNNYTELLNDTMKEERDDLYVCQRWYFFLAITILVAVVIFLSIVIGFLLCCFWRKNKNVEEADAEEKEGDEGENGSQVDPSDPNNNNQPPQPVTKPEAPQNSRKDPNNNKQFPPPPPAQQPARKEPEKGKVKFENANNPSQPMTPPPIPGKINGNGQSNKVGDQSTPNKSIPPTPPTPPPKPQPASPPPKQQPPPPPPPPTKPSKSKTTNSRAQIFKAPAHLSYHQMDPSGSGSS